MREELISRERYYHGRDNDLLLRGRRGREELPGRGGTIVVDIRRRSAPEGGRTTARRIRRPRGGRGSVPSTTRGGRTRLARTGQGGPTGAAEVEQEESHGRGVAHEVLDRGNHERFRQGGKCQNAWIEG